MSTNTSIYYFYGLNLSLGLFAWGRADDDAKRLEGSPPTCGDKVHVAQDLLYISFCQWLIRSDLQFFFTGPLRFILNHLYSITVWSAASQTTLWGGPGPRFEPGTGGPEAGTLPLDHHTSVCIFKVNLDSGCLILLLGKYYGKWG